MYWYNLPTPRGPLYCFTDPSNAAMYPPIPRGQLYSFDSLPAPAQSSKRVMIIYPSKVGFAPVGIDVDALAKYAGTFLGTQQNGVPVYLGKPVQNGWGQKSPVVFDLAQFPNTPQGVKDIVAAAGTRTLAWPLIAYVAIIVVAIAIAAMTIAVVVGPAWFHYEEYKLQIAAYDRRNAIIADSMKIVKEEWVQICSTGACDIKSGGPGCDIERVFWGNGDVWEFAHTPCGAKAIGGDSRLVKAGIDTAALADALGQPPVPPGPLGDIGAWAIPLAVIGIGGAILYAIVKGLGSRGEKK